MTRTPCLPVLLVVSLLFWSAADVAADSTEEERSLVVTATAYNSLPGQTDEHPNVTAWGHRLKPGMRVIAVSRDLLALGLFRGIVVEIEGLPGKWIVRDKMAKRWKRKIDIYMGKDVEAARRWGERQVTIHWSEN